MTCSGENAKFTTSGQSVTLGMTVPFAQFLTAADMRPRPPILDCTIASPPGKTGGAAGERDIAIDAYHRGFYAVFSASTRRDKNEQTKPLIRGTEGTQ